MLGSSILDVAIGLVFVYLLLSLMVTASSEMIAAWLKRRHNNLWEGIVNLLGPNQADKLYEHPLVRGLSPPSLQKVKWSDIRGIKLFYMWLRGLLRVDAGGPSYIPSRSFAIALLDNVGFKAGREFQNEIRGVLDHFPDAIGDAKALKDALQESTESPIFDSPDAVRDFQSFLLTIPDTTATAAAKEQILEFLNADRTKFGDLLKVIPLLLENGSVSRVIGTEIDHELNALLASSALSRQLRHLISDVPDSASGALLKEEVLSFLQKAPARNFLSMLPPGLKGSDLGKSLELLFEEADHDVEKFKEKIEVWFNDSMERVAGWYKRKTQFVNLLLALLITLALNVDTVLLVKTLSENSALRESLVTQATKFAEKPPAQFNNFSQPITETGFPKPAPQQTPAGSASGFPAFSLNPDTVVSGDQLKGLLTLSNAVESNITFIVSTSATNSMSFPTSVVVNQGQTFAEFTLNTKPIATPTRVTLSATTEKLPARTAVLTLTENPGEKFRLLQAQLENLNLPIGWIRSTNSSKVSTAKSEKATPGQKQGPEATSSVDSGQVEDRSHQLFLIAPWSEAGLWCATISFHFLGWILTAIAVSIGAPFWFDLLNKFIMIRSSGKAPEEKPKSPKEVPKPLEPGAQAAK